MLNNGFKLLHPSTKGKSFVDIEKYMYTELQSTLPNSKLHKSNNRLSRRSIQALFSLFFYPTYWRGIFCKSK